MNLDTQTEKWSDFLYQQNNQSVPHFIPITHSDLMQENGGFYLYDLMHCLSVSHFSMTSVSFIQYHLHIRFREHFGCAQDFKGWLRY